MMQKGGLEIHHLSVEQYSDYCEEKSNANSSDTKLKFLFQNTVHRARAIYFVQWSLLSTSTVYIYLITLARGLYLESIGPRS